MNSYVVDTNVLAVSNGEMSNVSLRDIRGCKEFLLSRIADSIFIVDSLSLIFDEYFKHASRSGKPGLGDYFAKWLWDNQFNMLKCERVDPEPVDPYFTQFKDVSFIGRLEAFDLSDRKFVVVAIKSKNNPEICNATDSDWWKFKNELVRIGVQIKFLCQDYTKNWIFT